MSGQGVCLQVGLLLDSKHALQQPFAFQAPGGAAPCTFPVEHSL